MFDFEEKEKNIDPLQMAKELLNDETEPKLDVENDIGLDEFIINLIKTNLCATISIKYELGDVYVIAVSSTGTNLTTFSNYTEDSYNDFCQNILGIDTKERFNCSRTIGVEGIKTRVYAVMPPFTKTPNITISTTKVPPKYLEGHADKDELFDEIVHSNFIIVGASGSGKTYLTNYLLSKYIKDDERIALIEEFGELIPPNNLTTSIIVPPPKPGEEHLLKFMTEQSNLMRLDAVYVGEIKSGEAWPFIVNLASGTRGGATLHGDSAQHALSRLRALCQLSTTNTDAINEFIAKSIKYIIVMKSKRIEGIYRLTGTQNRGNFGLEEIAS